MFGKRILVILALAFGLALGVVALGAPVLAGGTDPAALQQGQAVALTGAVSIDSSGRMLVGGYVVIPATTDVPSIMRPGDIVIVIGLLLADGRTIYADSITLYDGGISYVPTLAPTAILPPTRTLVTIPPPIPTRVWTPVPTAVRVNETDDCNREGQPVAERIADAFDVSYDTVMDMHCAGNGFGEITRAFMLQVNTGVSAWTYLQRHQDGVGWGQIVGDSGMDPSDLAPGQIISKGNKCEDGNGPPGQCKKLGGDGPGNGNGHGNGNGNGNGNGKGHDD